MKHVQTDTFDYIVYDQESLDLSADIRAAMVAVENLLYRLNQSRPRSLAATKLEEAHMWAGKAIRDDQLNREAGEAS